MIALVVSSLRSRRIRVPSLLTQSRDSTLSAQRSESRRALRGPEWHAALTCQKMDESASAAILQPIVTQIAQDPTAALLRARSMPKEPTAQNLLWQMALGLAVSQSDEAADVLLPGGTFELVVEAQLRAAKQPLGQRTTPLNVWRQLSGLSGFFEAIRSREALLESKTIQQTFLDLVDALWQDRIFLTRDAIHAEEAGYRFVSLSMFVPFVELGSALKWPRYNAANENKFYAPLIAMAFTASTQAIMLATGNKTVFSAARTTSAADGRNWNFARQAVLGIGPIMSVNAPVQCSQGSFGTFCDRHAYFAPQLWAEIGQLSRPAIRESAIAAVADQCRRFCRRDQALARRVRAFRRPLLRARL